MVPQMVMALAEKAVTARDLDAAGLSAAPASLGTAQTAMTRARQEGVAAFPKKAVKTLPLSCLEARPVPPEYVQLFRYRGGLHLLLSELRGDTSLSLGAVDAAEVVEVVNFCVIIGRPQHCPDIAVCQVLYAVPRFRNHMRFSWVAVDSLKGVEWYGQVQLLFKFRGKNYAYIKYVIAETDAALLGGELLDTPGCGLYKWADSYGVVDVERIIRREVFFPDVSKLFAAANDEPRGTKRGAPRAEGTEAPKRSRAVAKETDAGVEGPEHRADGETVAPGKGKGKANAQAPPQPPPQPAPQREGLRRQAASNAGAVTVDKGKGKAKASPPPQDEDSRQQDASPAGSSDDDAGADPTFKPGAPEAKRKRAPQTAAKGKRAPQTAAKGKAAKPAAGAGPVPCTAGPAFTATYWIRTQLVWGINGGRPVHDVAEDDPDTGEE
jgi:hypothetical protein